MSVAGARTYLVSAHEATVALDIRSEPLDDNGQLAGAVT